MKVDSMKKELLNEIALLYLLQVSGGVPTRIRLQKLVCLAKYQSSSPFSFNYQSYYYGPYSEELRIKTDEMVHRGLISESIESTNNGDGFFYFYHITKKGKAILSQYLKQLKKDLKPVADVVRQYRDKPNEVIIQAAKAISGLESTRLNGHTVSGG